MKHALFFAFTGMGLLALTACNDPATVNKKSEPQAAAPASKAPAEQLVQVLSFIQDQTTAGQHVQTVTECVAALPRQITHEEGVAIMNEVLRLDAQSYYNNATLEQALRHLPIDTKAYTETPALDVDGYEPEQE